MVGLVFWGLAGVRSQAERADSFEFLRLPAGPRTAALGGAGVADASDLAGAQLNPAGLGRLWRDEVGFSGARWIDDVQYQTAGYGHPFVGGGALAANLIALNYGTIPSYSPGGGTEGSISAQDSAVRLGYGRNGGDRFWWGAQGVYAQETLAGEKASAVAMDGGIIWQPVRTGPLRTASFGAAFRNAGKGPRFDGNKTESLPSTFQVGGTLRPFFEGLTVSVDGEQSGSAPISLRTGIEYWARSAVAFRLGYNGREAREGNGVTLGFGFRAWDFEVDYGYSGFGALGESHHMGLVYRFGSLAEKFYERGLHSLQQQDYAQAVVYFARAVSIDPHHRRALEQLREANAKLQSELKPVRP